ncbi:unnamed protein product [Amoebophrya sp. A120]|nr:unnamed protein product [Amoebophrya sp. A120]|eukprot:GSA120T00020213001.1
MADNAWDHTSGQVVIEESGIIGEPIMTGAPVPKAAPNGYSKFVGSLAPPAGEGVPSHSGDPTYVSPDLVVQEQSYQNGGSSSTAQEGVHRSSDPEGGGNPEAVVHDSGGSEDEIKVFAVKGEVVEGLTGEIKVYDPQSGWGFILANPCTLDTDVFLHRNQFQDVESGPKELISTRDPEKTKVRFTMDWTDESKPKAQQVVIISGPRSQPVGKGVSRKCGNCYSTVVWNVNPCVVCGKDQYYGKGKGKGYGFNGKGKTHRAEPYRYTEKGGTEKGGDAAERAPSVGKGGGGSALNSPASAPQPSMREYEGW